MPGSSAAGYAEREQEYAARRDEARRRSAALSRARLATFLAALAALLWWVGFDGRSVAAGFAFVLLAIFGALVVVHARVDARADRFEARRTVAARGTARLERRWDDLPPAAPPPGIDVDGHPYATDLDLFGRASVFQWVGPAATSFGSITLAGWLLRPAPAPEIAWRQRAVEELAPLDDWRDHLSAFGLLAGGTPPAPLDGFLRWAGGTAPPVARFDALRILVYALTASILVPLLLHATGGLPNGIWIFPLLVGITLSFLTATSVSHAFDQAGGGERAVRQYAEVLAHIEGQRWTSERLRRLRGALVVEGPRAHGRPASAEMRALNRILGFADLRRGAALLHFPIQALTLWDFHCLFALERWRHRAGAHVADWFAAAGEVDALACLATIRRDHPAWCFPEISAERRYAATALGHPLLPDGRRVDNDVEVGPPGTVLLVTGSNMSGKSTLLRAIGVNAVLGEAGAPVCAAALRMPPCDVQTSIRIQDSLERGVSYFMAALARLKRVIDAAEAPSGGRSAETGEARALLYLLDEILQGTNSAERGMAVQAVARHLLDAGAIGVMTTHDLNLAGEEPLRSRARLVHFTELVDADGTMRFDYRLREGLATSRNALRLMEMIGISLPRP